jgi:hypothetical protein
LIFTSNSHQQHLLRKDQRVKCQGHVLIFYLLRLSVGLRIVLSNHFSLKLFSDYLKKNILILFFTWELNVVYKFIHLLGFGPSILLTDQMISIHTRINHGQGFSAVVILWSIRKLVFVYRNRTSNDRLCNSMCLRWIVYVRRLTVAVSWRHYGAIVSWNK